MHYNWGIVGSGWIAHDMANTLIQEGVGIYGVASGHLSSAKKFSEEFSIEHVYENYQAMFEDENIDIEFSESELLEILEEYAYEKLYQKQNEDDSNFNNISPSEVF